MCGPRVARDDAAVATGGSHWLGALAPRSVSNGPAAKANGCGAPVRDTLGPEMLEARSALTERQQAGLAIFGLGPEFVGARWVSQGGADSVVLAHGNPRAR